MYGGFGRGSGGGSCTGGAVGSVGGVGGGAGGSSGFVGIWDLISHQFVISFPRKTRRADQPRIALDPRGALRPEAGDPS